MDFISVLGNILLFSLVFGMSATVDISCMRQQITNFRAILTGMFCQFIVLPLLGFIVVRTIHMNHAMGVTLLVVTSSPGGSYSNWFASMFNADLALSGKLVLIRVNEVECGAYNSFSMETHSHFVFFVTSHIQQQSP